MNQRRDPKYCEIPVSAVELKKQGPDTEKLQVQIDAVKNQHVVLLMNMDSMDSFFDQMALLLQA